MAAVNLGILDLLDRKTHVNGKEIRENAQVEGLKVLNKLELLSKPGERARATGTSLPFLTEASTSPFDRFFTHNWPRRSRGAPPQARLREPRLSIIPIINAGAPDCYGTLMMGLPEPWYELIRRINICEHMRRNRSSDPKGPRESHFARFCAFFPNDTVRKIYMSSAPRTPPLPHAAENAGR
jgi:hypothetical protein